MVHWCDITIELFYFDYKSNITFLEWKGEFIECLPLYRQIPAQSPPSRNRFRNRCGRNRIAGGHQSGKNEYRIAGTRTSGPARDGFWPRYCHGSEYRTPVVQRIRARTEQGGGTCNPYQPLFRLFMGGKKAMLSVRNIRFRFGEYHHHLHGYHPFTDRSVAFFEKA